MSEKAMVIEKRYSKQCAICMLIDADNKAMKWHIFREGTDESNDAFVCDDCLEGVKGIRNKCHQKINNPHHNIFQDFIPWFATQIPGMNDAFKKLAKKD